MFCFFNKVFLMASPRSFSNSLQATNSLYLPQSTENKHVYLVGFVLLEHFSMMSFTAAVDVLVTANLVQAETVYIVSSFGLKNTSVTSDLGIDIATSAIIAEINNRAQQPFDLLFVCGGLRCDLTENSKLSQTIKTADKRGTLLGGIWNGVVSLVQANQLKQQPCALHIDNHPLMQEHFPAVNLTNKSFIYTTDHLSCADALGALEMMLAVVEDTSGKATFNAVKEILNCNRVFEGSVDQLIQFGDSDQFPAVLRNAIQLMHSNIEETISIDDIAVYLAVNRRQLERLFKQHMDTSPSRHYLEIRLTYARRLLVQSKDSITSIAIACGFISSNHFSNCFSQYFRMSPSTCRKHAVDSQP